MFETWAQGCSPRHSKGRVERISEVLGPPGVSRRLYEIDGGLGGVTTSEVATIRRSCCPCPYRIKSEVSVFWRPSGIKAVCIIHPGRIAGRIASCVPLSKTA